MNETCLNVQLVLNELNYFVQLVLNRMNDTWGNVQLVLKNIFMGSCVQSIFVPVHCFRFFDAHSIIHVISTSLYPRSRNQLVGRLVERSVNETQSVTPGVRLSAIKSATGGIGAGGVGHISSTGYVMNDRQSPL